MSPAAAELALPVIGESPAEDGTSVALEWSFPGHGSARARCGKVVKVGHCKSDERWCLWDELYRCRSHSCPECFDKPGGYAYSEAQAISDRLEKYFDLRNLAVIRGWELRRAARFDRAADKRERGARRGRARAIRRFRIEAARARGRSHCRKPVHVVVAPPPERWGEISTVEGYRALRAEAYEQARMRGVDGGVAVFHHKRLRSSRWAGNASLFEPDELDVPADGLHWHIVGDGWVSPRGPLHQRSHQIAVDHQDQARNVLQRVRSLEREQLPRASRAALARNLAFSLPSIFYGLTEAAARARGAARAEWFVSNKGVRASVFQTALYVLTHAGFASLTGSLPEPTELPEMSRVVTSYPRARGPVETVTWWGSCSARSFPVPTEPSKTCVCKRCGERIGARAPIPVVYLPAGPPPAGDVDGNPDDWRAEGLTPPTNRAEISERLARRLRRGTWKVRSPRGLERWQIQSANAEADEEWSRSEWDRVEASVYGADVRPAGNRRATREAFDEADREERWSS
jgi:hypothetical protein